ncbi:hypothetical protein PPERSA_03904 [Pseudocohnilembus persalinus]|uniref:C2H2-type domain-containing protein n=1 Tax=Pseudocohnilembus persalinus TaxID=266149 RepID=A0A0V0Q9D3_PSEPJ|nr:hypothetical protein PPERSA_03904 [Pseudocohnilembus persalinus]|eukprot:KRW98769.1 hypothetical protein PPERSA_03904 [Pseudocohnilembus persalinus]
MDALFNQEQMFLLLQQQQLQQQMAQKQSQLSQMSMFLSMCPNFDENANYPQEILKVVITNEYLYNQIQDLLSDRKTLQQRISNLEAKIEEHQGENSQYSQESQKKKNRRTAQEIQKSFICPYENCSKAYGSDVSLNLHIKIKHNGGSKTEREKLAKAILLAKMNKDEIPKLNIDFPPGYLDNFEEYIKQDLEQQQNEEGQVDQTSSKQLEQPQLKTENKNIETQEQTESLDQMVENKKDDELQLQQLLSHLKKNKNYF